MIRRVTAGMVSPILVGRMGELSLLVAGLEPVVLAREGERAVGPVTVHDLELLGEHVHARLQRREGEPERRDDRPRVKRAPLGDALQVELVVGAEEGGDAVRLAGLRERQPLRPRHALLAFDHRAEVHRSAQSGM